MELEDLYAIAKAKGLEFYSGDGDWNGDPDYQGPNRREIIVKYGSDNTPNKEFTNGEDAVKFCSTLDCTYAIWHGVELVIAFTKPGEE